jgi:hypothetical protein
MLRETGMNRVGKTLATKKATLVLTLSSIRSWESLTGSADLYCPTTIEVTVYFLPIGVTQLL